VKNYDAWNIEPLDLSAQHNKEDVYRHLVGWAVLAANSHNSQPWRFVICPDDNCINVVLDNDSILPASDKSGRQAHISIGCAMQNLFMAAAAYGLSPKIIFDGLPDINSGTVLAKILFNDVTLALSNYGPDMFLAIKDRRMYRGQYDPGRALPDYVIDGFNSIAFENGVELKLITDKPTIFAIAEIQYTADRAVIALNDFRSELSKFMLPNDTNNYVAQKGPFDPSLAAGVAASGRDGIRSSPVLGVISVSDDSPEYWLKAGSAFQNMAIVAEDNDLSMAVHAAMVEVKMFNVLLKARLIQLGRPTVIFRVGYAYDRWPHSPRMSAGTVIK
jgi:nitroreductase